MKKKIFYFILLLLPLLIFSQGSGKSLNFNGNTQVVSIPSFSTNIGNSDFTVECYAKFDNFSDYGGVITTFISSSGGWAIHQQIDGSVSFFLGNNSSAGGGESVNSNILLTGIWYHIVGIKRGPNIELYVNGELQGSTISNRTIPYNACYIGSRYLDNPLGSQWRHNGNIDEIRIWNIAISQAEIKNWMCKKITNAHPNYTKLVAYFNFDSGSGSTLVDLTSNGNDGTLVNNPNWQTSSAPIGDDNAYLTAVSAGSNLNLAHSSGSDLTVNVTSGTAESIYIYNVTEQPNVTTPPLGLDQLSQSNYFGVKAFGSSSLVYEVVYNYDGHSGISDENNLRLNSRADNGTSSWTEEVATLNTTLNTITLGNQTGTEFILGSISGNTLPIAEYEMLNFSVYPNPTSNFLKLSESEIFGKQYQVFDVSGKIVLEGNIFNKTIDVSNLKQGLYFLKLENNILHKFFKK